MGKWKTKPKQIKDPTSDGFRFTHMEVQVVHKAYVKCGKNYKVK